MIYRSQMIKTTELLQPMETQKIMKSVLQFILSLYPHGRVFQSRDRFIPDQVHTTEFSSWFSKFFYCNDSFCVHS